MKKLIYFEIKKILKSKFNLVMILLIMGSCFYMVIDQSQGIYYSERNQNISLEGKEMTSVETMRYIDEFKHLHAAKADDYVLEMSNLYQFYITSLNMDEMDDEAMKKAYGDNYLEIIEMGQKGTMSEEELSAYRSQIYELALNGNDQAQMNMNEDGTFTLNPIYKNADKRRMLEFMFEPSYEILTHKEDYLIDYEAMKDLDKKAVNGYVNVENGFIHTVVKLEDVHQMSEDKINSINQKFLTNSDEVDSHVGVYLLNYLLCDGNMVYGRLMILLLILILSSDIFSVENSTHADQIIVCSKNGNCKITLAKLLTLFIISMAIYMIFILFVLIYTSCLVPIRNWNIVNAFSYYLFTYKEMILTNLSMSLLASLATAYLGGFFSCMTKSRFASMILVLMFLLYPLFAGSWSDYRFPSIMVYGAKIWDMISGKYYRMLIWIPLVLIVSLICYCKQKRHRVK